MTPKYQREFYLKMLNSVHVLENYRAKACEKVKAGKQKHRKQPEQKPEENLSAQGLSAE